MTDAILVKDPPTDEMNIPVMPAALSALQSDQEKMERLYLAATDFREFLRHWQFVDGETGKIRSLGDELWEGQEEFVQAMKDHKRVFALKARKLGFTTLGCAYDGWVARFGKANARVHLFSRREMAARELLKAVKFGLDHLPEWMQLSVHGRPRTDVLELYAGPDDVRTIQAYPADEDTAVESSATHAHVDEWARMGNPERVYQAIEPSLAGTAHIITTGMGPANYPAKFWRMSMSGDTSFLAFFVGALKRGGRDQQWLAAKRKGMTETQFAQEYAMRWEDALFGGGTFTFAREDLDICCHGSGQDAAEVGHKYSIGWDIGRHADAAVGVVLDLTAVPVQVVDYVRLRGVPYPTTQAAIEKQWAQYGQVTTGRSKSRLQVEKNGPGEAVLENLNIPERDLEESAFSTTKPSKMRIISNLEIGFENHGLEYDGNAWPQLDSELRGYQIPDDNVIQDSVMALAIAFDEVHGAAVRGKVRRIISW